MYEEILIPLDGSRIAETAATFAGWLPARRYRLLRVEPEFQRLAPGELENFRPDWRDVRVNQIQREMAPLAERLASDDSVADVLVRFGDPAEEIITVSADSDLITMTTHGRGFTGRALFGSIADRVARHGVRPVLLVRGADSDVGASAPARVVAPLDGSALSEQALPEAVRLASSLGVPIALVRVLDPEESGLQRDAETDLQAGPPSEVPSATALQALDAVAEPLRSVGVTVHTEVLIGAPAASLLGLVQPDDVVVMTTHGHGGVRRWLLGSVAEKLVRAAAGPVMLVPARGAG